MYYGVDTSCASAAFSLAPLRLVDHKRIAHGVRARERVAFDTVSRARERERERRARERDYAEERKRLRESERGYAA